MLKANTHHSFAAVNKHVNDTMKQVEASAAASLIILNGEIVNEWYTGHHTSAPNSRPVDQYSQFHIASIRKTYLGLAIGIALHEGKIRHLDEKISDYLDDLFDEQYEDISIRHLLTHTHGLATTVTERFKAGTDWAYNNEGVNLLIRLVKVLFQRSLAEVIDDYVLKPCDFINTRWHSLYIEQLVSVDEHFTGQPDHEPSLFVSTRELAYWGQLHLNKGYYKGIQILPQSVFEHSLQMTTPDSLPVHHPRHGFFWWIQDETRNHSEIGNCVPKGSFQSLGFFGNAVLVIPHYNIVAVRMLNQTNREPVDFDYLVNIQQYGNTVIACIEANLSSC